MVKANCNKCGGKLIFAEYPEMGNGMHELEVIMDCTKCDTQYIGYYTLLKLEEIIYNDE